MNAAWRSRRLGLCGFGEHPWRSVDRTRRFYLSALEREFELVFLEQAQEPPDVGAVLSFGGEVGWRLLEGAQVPYLFAVHGGATLEHAELRAHANRLRDADTLIINCQSDETILSKLFQARRPRFCRLPLPAHPLCFEPLDRAEARAQLPFDGEPDLVIGFVARLLPQKNFHQFLILFAELKARLAPRRVDAVVVGEYWVDYPVLPYVTEQYRSYVASLAAALGVAERVVYLGGKLNDVDLRLAYGAMDLLLHPTCSIDENFGYVPVEAMACGVPVVGAAYGGLKDTIVDGETGYLMPTWTTPSGLRMDLIGGVDDAERILSQAPLRERLSAAARAHAAAQFSDERCARILLDAVHAAIDTPTPFERLSAAAPIAASEPAGYLPSLEVGWEHYLPIVADYTSGRTPEIEDTTRLRLAAPARLEGSRLALQDAAWPAVFELTSEERRVCLACQSTTGAEALAAEAGLLRALVDRGVLIASNTSRGAL